MGSYTWYQTDSNVTISFQVESDDYNAVDIACSTTNIRAGVRGDAPVVDGTLAGNIVPGSSKWGFMSSAGTGATFVQIMLGKALVGPWASLFADGSGPSPSRYVITTYDYAAEEDTEIGFGPGDYIEVLSEDPSGWWQGSYYGFVGTFPSNFTEPLDPNAEIFYTNNDETFPLNKLPPQGGVGIGAALNSEMAEKLQRRQTKSREEEEAEAAAAELARQQAEALAQQQMEAFAQPGTTIPVVAMGADGKGYVRGTFDYEAADEGELGFHVGDVITVLSQDDSGWWQGELNGARGWFPANFTEACPAPGRPAARGRPSAAALDEAIGSAKVETLTSFSRARVKGKRPPTQSTRLGAGIKTRTETNDPVHDDAGEREREAGPSPRLRVKSMMPGAPGMTGELQSLFNKGGKGPAKVAPSGPVSLSASTPGRGPITRRNSGGERPSGGGLPFSVNLRSSKEPQPAAPQPAATQDTQEAGGLPFAINLRSSKKQQPAAPQPAATQEPQEAGGLPFAVNLRSSKKQQPAAPGPKPAAPGPKPMPKGAPGVVVKSKPQAPGPKPMPKGAPGVVVKSKPQAPGPKPMPKGAPGARPAEDGAPVPIRAAPLKPVKRQPVPAKQQPAPAPAPAPAAAPVVVAAAAAAAPEPEPEIVIQKEEAPAAAPAPQEEVAEVPKSAPVAAAASPAPAAAAAAPAATEPANWPRTLPPFDVFCKELTELFEAALGKSGSGAPAADLPAARCSAGYAVCTMDGHIHRHGAEGGAFSLQGAAWPLLFALCAPGKAAEHIGKEYAPSGGAAVHSRAPSPLTRAGALVLSALALEEAPAGEPWERLDAVAAAASALAGAPVGYSMAAYAKARKGSAAAWANAYALRAAGNLPGAAGVADVADFFFQVNALQMTAEQAAAFAAGIANEGVSPVTKERTEGCFTQTVSMTSSMGVAHDVPQKIPSAGGESGAVLMFIPHVCGIAVFSPEIGSDGVSVAGAEFVRQVAAKYKFK